jgi:hypothetical protein
MPVSGPLASFSFDLNETQICAIRNKSLREHHDLRPFGRSLHAKRAFDPVTASPAP